MMDLKILNIFFSLSIPILFIFWMLGATKTIEVDDKYLEKLFYLFILELIGVSTIYFKKTFGKGNSIPEEILGKTCLKFQPRKELVADWVDKIKEKSPREVVIVNGISRKDIADVPKMKLFNETISQVETTTLVWDSRFNHATRFFQIKDNDENYKDIDLKQHILDKVTTPLRAFSKRADLAPNLHLKILPFPISYTFLKIDNEIYVTLLGAVRGSDCPTFLITENDEATLFKHFEVFINHLVKMSAPVGYDNKTKKPIISEFLQIVDSSGDLLTTLPRKYIEELYANDDTHERKNLGHRHIYCFVISDSGKILLQKRAKGKDNEGLWDKSVGAHVQFEETTLTACIRELEEELGIKFNESEHRLTLIHNQKKPTELERFVSEGEVKKSIIEYSSYELFLIQGVDEDKIKIDTNEVEKIEWFSQIEVVNFIEKNQGKVTPDLLSLKKYLSKPKYFIPKEDFSI